MPTNRLVLSLALVSLVAVHSVAARQDPPTPPPPIPAPENVAKAPGNADVNPSGLASIVLTKGTGKVKPGSQSVVTIHYTGWTRAGKMIDSTVQRGKPLTAPVGAFIKGWIEGLQLMVVGEKRRLWIPGKLAYDTADDVGKPKGPLVFDIELLAIVK